MERRRIEREWKHISKQHIRGGLGETGCFDRAQHTARQMKILQKCEPLPWKTWHMKREGSERIRISIHPFIYLFIRPSALTSFCLFSSCCIFLQEEEDPLHRIINRIPRAEQPWLRGSASNFYPTLLPSSNCNFCPQRSETFCSCRAQCDSPDVALPVFTRPSYLCILQDRLLCVCVF